jgi:hypothetical protein
VDAYFADLDKEGIVPAEGFNRNGRGYPDVSVLAVYVRIRRSFHA